jgi:hypothetical protein
MQQFSHSRRPGEAVEGPVSDTVSETRSHDCSGHALSRQVRGSDPRTWLAGTRRVRTPGVSPGVRLWDDDLALVDRVQRDELVATEAIRLARVKSQDVV